MEPRDIDDPNRAADKPSETASETSNNAQIQNQQQQMARMRDSSNSNNNQRQPYRFVRLNPRWDAAETLQLLKSELPPHNFYPRRVPWLPSEHFYALPDNFPLHQSSTFQSGRVYGQDVSSGAAVAALLRDDYDEHKSGNGSISDIKGKSSNYNDTAAADDRETVSPHAPGERILDLCCAPGLKLCALADGAAPGSTVIGVDRDLHRLQVTQKILHKYHIIIDPMSMQQQQKPRQVGSVDSSASKEAEKATTTDENIHTTRSAAPAPQSNTTTIRLYHSDGQTFGSDAANGLTKNLVWDSHAAREDYATHLGKRRRLNKSARRRQRQRLREIAQDIQRQQQTCSGSSTAAVVAESAAHLPLFDRVLVDAECTTDGSVKHQQKRIDKAMQAKTAAVVHEAPLENRQEEQLNNPEQLAELVALQRNLLASGFRSLKPGGVLVYSTCSLCEDQNEGVVRWLLDQHPQAATLLPVRFPGTQSQQQLVRGGSLRGTVQFLPNIVSNDNDTTTPCANPSNSQETESSVHDQALDVHNLFGGGFFLAKIRKVN